MIVPDALRRLAFGRVPLSVGAMGEDGTDPLAQQYHIVEMAPIEEEAQLAGDLASVERQEDATEQFLRRLVEAISAPRYEYLGPYSFGGPTNTAGTEIFAGAYDLECPFNGPAEVAIFQVAFGAAGQAYIGFDGAQDGQAFLTTSAAPSGTSRKRGWFYMANAEDTKVPAALIWAPIAFGERLTLVGATTGNVSIVVGAVFRRLLHANGTPVEALRS